MLSFAKLTISRLNPSRLNFIFVLGIFVLGIIFSLLIMRHAFIVIKEDGNMDYVFFFFLGFVLFIVSIVLLAKCLAIVGIM